MKWVKSKVLGKGAFGTVSLAVSTDHSPYDIPSQLAVKSANINTNNYDSLLKEGKILHELRGCPQIVRCFGDDVSVENGEEVYNLLLEVATGGTLDDTIDDSGNYLPEFAVSIYAYMLLLGLDHIHRKGYVHCDLKPSNILVFPSSTEGGGSINRLKIADFGVTKRAGSRDNVKKCGQFYRAQGTVFYNSPESVLSGEKEWQSDIWSLGCILTELLTGKVAYSECQDLETLLEQIAYDEKLPEIPCLSNKGTNFLKKCLIRDPKKRWNATRLLNHPFIVNNVKKLLSHQRELLLWEDQPIRYTEWWSGKSSFYNSIPPTPVCLEQPAQSSSDNLTSPEQSSSSQTPSSFLPPHEIYSENHAASGQSISARLLLPHQIFQKDNVAAKIQTSVCLLPHQIFANDFVESEKPLSPVLPAIFQLPHEIFSRNQDANGSVLCT